MPKSPKRFVTHKMCGECHVNKSRTDFQATSGNLDGLRGICKNCNAPKKALTAKQWKAAWTPEYKAKVKARAAADYRANTKKFRDANLRSKFGISIAVYEAMLKAQSGACAICFGVSADGRALHVDHDHSTGEVRGLLCDNCNRGLGMYRDNEALLHKAAAYLAAYRRSRLRLVI